MVYSKNILSIAKCSAAALSILLFFTGCEKETRTGVQSTSSVEQQLLDEARKNLSFVIPQQMQNFAGESSFNFSEPAPGNTYSNGDGSVTYASSSNGVNFSSSLSLTIGGSGSAKIDGTNHDFDFVICGDLYLELFEGDELEEDFNITIFIGISGDFNNPENVQIESLLEFVAFQESLNGSIDLGAADAYENESADFGFLYFIDASDSNEEADAFETDPTSPEEGVKVYFSYDGNANVSSGMLSFNNIDMIEILHSEGEGDMVKGSGQLLCN